MTVVSRSSYVRFVLLSISELDVVGLVDVTAADTLTSVWLPSSSSSSAAAAAAASFLTIRSSDLSTPSSSSSSKGKKARRSVLDIALLTLVPLMSRSTQQSQKCQLIDILSCTINCQRLWTTGPAVQPEYIASPASHQLLIICHPAEGTRLSWYHHHDCCRPWTILYNTLVMHIKALQSDTGYMRSQHKRPTLKKSTRKGNVPVFI